MGKVLCRFAALNWSGLSRPYDEVIFFACPKKTDPKETTPGDVALRVPCARAQLKAVGQQHIHVLEAHAGNPLPARVAAQAFICTRARRHQRGLRGAESEARALRCRMGRAKRNPSFHVGLRQAPYPPISLARSRSTCFCTFPVGVVGSSSNTTVLGALKCAMWSRQ